MLDEDLKMKSRIKGYHEMQALSQIKIPPTGIHLSQTQGLIQITHLEVIVVITIR